MEEKLEEFFTRSQYNYLLDKITNCMMSLAHLERGIKEEKKSLNEILNEIRSVGIKKEVNTF